MFIALIYFGIAAIILAGVAIWTAIEDECTYWPSAIAMSLVWPIALFCIVASPIVEFIYSQKAKKEF